MWRALKYLQHLFYLRHRKGFGIHSPGLFELVNGVIFNAHKLRVPGEIRAVHRELRNNRTQIEKVPPGSRVQLMTGPGGKAPDAGGPGAGGPGAAIPGTKGNRTEDSFAEFSGSYDPATGPRAKDSAAGLPGSGDPGAGSRAARSEYRTVGSFVRRSSVSPRYGELLYRMVRWFEPGMIIELGTGLGISTLYLAAGSPVTPLHTVEGQPSRADFSAHLIKRCGFFSVKVHVGEIGEVLERLPEAGEKRFLAFVDGNHQYGPTVTYLRKLIEMAGEETVVIMDDIYWSRGMHRAWREIISWQEVRASIDLFHVGILWLRKDLTKTKLKMKF